MNAEKPHIERIREGWWKCAGFLTYGFGNTPALAYWSWERKFLGRSVFVNDAA